MNKLIKLSDVHRQAINNLKENVNLFKLSSTNKIISEYSILGKDLVNMSMRVNTNYNYPNLYDGGNFLPAAFTNPYPIEEKEMRFSVLKNSGQRLLEPVIIPDDRKVVKRGSLLKLSYLDINIQNVNFRYTINPNLIPTHFSGIKVCIYII
jgi:hypothetical protein